MGLEYVFEIESRNEHVQGKRLELPAGLDKCRFCANLEFQQQHLHLPRVGGGLGTDRIQDLRVFYIPQCSRPPS